MNQLTSSELRAWIQEGHEFVLIDVREAWERESYNIGGTHIPMAELFSPSTQIPADKDVVLYCEKGIRSLIAIQRFEAAGYHNLFNLAGGMRAWKASL